MKASHAQFFFVVGIILIGKELQRLVVVVVVVEIGRWRNAPKLEIIAKVGCRIDTIGEYMRAVAKGHKHFGHVVYHRILNKDLCGRIE